MRLGFEVRVTVFEWDNVCVHRAAVNDIDFTRDDARRSVCNTLVIRR